MKSQFYDVFCDICGRQIGVCEECYDRYGDTVCADCAPDFDREELEKISVDDAAYNNAGHFIPWLDDARER